MVVVVVGAAVVVVAGGGANVVVVSTGATVVVVVISTGRARSRTAASAAAKGSPPGRAADTPSTEAGRSAGSFSRLKAWAALVRLSMTTFTKPFVSSMAIARPLTEKGNFPTSMSCPCSFACSSVRPTDATSGWQYVQLGTLE